MNKEYCKRVRMHKNIYILSVDGHENYYHFHHPRSEFGTNKVSNKFKLSPKHFYSSGMSDPNGYKMIHWELIDNGYKMIHWGLIEL